MKTLLMENAHLASLKTLEFVKNIDINYIEYNTEVRNYMRSNDLFIFAKLIQPNLENIVTSSSFQTIMPYEYKKNNDFDRGYKQIEYYSYLFYNAIAFRKGKNLPCLNFHIDYLNVDFLRDLDEGELGEDTKSYIKLMLRQSEGFVKFFIYKDYKIQHTLLTEEDLNL